MRSSAAFLRQAFKLTVSWRCHRNPSGLIVGTTPANPLRVKPECLGLSAALTSGTLLPPFLKWFPPLDPWGNRDTGRASNWPMPSTCRIPYAGRSGQGGRQSQSLDQRAPQPGACLTTVTGSGGVALRAFRLRVLAALMPRERLAR